MEIPISTHRAVGPALFFAALWLTVSCARLGEPAASRALPEDAPPIEAILADLAANDQAIQNFRASGSFSLESPERPGIDRFKGSLIAYRRPADLHVVGRKAPTYTKVFVLTSVGDEFLIDFPTEKEHYYRIEGEQFESVPFSVSPSDVAREMFLPEDWQQLRPNQVRLADYDAQNQRATLTIHERGLLRRLRRRVELEGLPWRVRKSTLYDKSGAVIAETQKSAYMRKDRILFPSHIEVAFPGEDTRMVFDMRRIDLNTQLEDELFDVQALRRYVIEELGHTPMEPYAPNPH